MIRNNEELKIVHKQLGLIEDALASLRQDVLPKNKSNYEILSEGYVDQIFALRNEIDTYLGLLEPKQKSWKMIKIEHQARLLLYFPWSQTDEPPGLFNRPCRPAPSSGRRSGQRPAERGRIALTTRFFTPATWTMTGYENAWKNWQPLLKEARRPITIGLSALITDCTRPLTKTAACRWDCAKPNRFSCPGRSLMIACCAMPAPSWAQAT